MVAEYHRSSGGPYTCKREIVPERRGTCEVRPDERRPVICLEEKRLTREGCCNNCPRDDSPRRQLSKGLLSNDTVVQGDYCPMRLLSKEAFTSEKLAQINFSYFLLEVTTFIDYRISKKIM